MRWGRRRRSWSRASVADRRLAEQQRRGHGMDARQLYAVLRERRLASRPVVGHTEPTRFHWGEPIYGLPTFRNYIDKNGKHV